MSTAKKYQIFISSTFVDLKQERQDAIGVVLDLGHIPAGMELFPASDVAQVDHIKRIVDQCDYYVLIMGARYGSTDEAGISFTEREYDYAVEKGKVVLAFPHAAPEDLTKGADVDRVAAERFQTFRSKVLTGRLVKQWKTREDLTSSVIIALHHAMTDYPQSGWIRGDAAASEETLGLALKVQEENVELRASISMLESAQRPAFDNLADLTDQFKVRYRKYERGAWQITPIALTWAELLKVVGPAFFKPSVPAIGDAALKTHLKEVHNMPHGASVMTEDEITVRLQLIALGLLQSRNATDKDGGILEFVSLTDLGRSKLLELSSIRKA